MHDRAPACLPGFEITERLYRDIRALRIYKGASDGQKVTIARQSLGARAAG